MGTRSESGPRPLHRPISHPAAAPRRRWDLAPHSSHEASGGEAPSPHVGKGVEECLHRRGEGRGKAAKAGTCLLKGGMGSSPLAVLARQRRGDLDGSELVPLCQQASWVQAGGCSNPSWRKPEASSRHGFAAGIGAGPPPISALVGWPGAGEGKGKGCWGCRRGWHGKLGGHVLVCQRYCFWVRRGDHEADPRGADLVSRAVCHLPNVSAVLLQGVVGSSAYLALGDRNRSQQQVRKHHPPCSTPAAPGSCTCREAGLA